MTFVEELECIHISTADKVLDVPTLILVAAVTLELNVAAPVEAMESLFPLFVAKSKVFAALKYIPLVGTVAPLGINAVAVFVELTGLVEHIGDTA